VMVVVLVYLVGKVIPVILVSTLPLLKLTLLYYHCPVVNSTMCGPTCHEFA